MRDSKELNLRLSRLIDAAEALKGRANADSFGSAEQLEEIGFLALRLAALEELIALFCETFLMRPELGGFYGPDKQPVLTKSLSEKLALYRMLTTASGVLYGISTDSIEKSIVSAKAVGEDRNIVIHGLLSKRNDGKVVFRGRGRDVPASLGELRSLTKRCYQVAFDLTTHFSQFYTDLVGRKSTHALIEASVQNALQAHLKLETSASTARESFVAVRKLKSELTHHTQKLQESRERLTAAKKAVRNARRRKRQGEKNAVKNVG